MSNPISPHETSLVEREEVPAKANSVRVQQLARQDHWPPAALDQALTLIDHYPRRTEWQQFINLVLLVLASALGVSGIFFFFAFNWNGLHRFAKLGVIEATLLVALGLAAYYRLDHLSGRIALTVAALLVGALLAVYGQIYQTGADVYTLFLLWAGLIMAWVFVAKFAPLWLLWLVLLNVSLGLYWDQVPFDAPYQRAIYQLLILLNGVPWLLWTWLRRREGFDWLRSPWIGRLPAVATLVFMVINNAQLIFLIDDVRWRIPNERLNLGLTAIGFALYVITLVAVYLWYTRRNPDLFMLALAAFSLVFTTNIALVEQLPFDPMAVGCVSGSFMVQTAIVVAWLRWVQRQQEEAARAEN